MKNHFHHNLVQEKGFWGTNYTSKCGTVGTPQWVLVYEMYGKKDLYTR